MSLDHIWVQYEGKPETAAENPSRVITRRVDDRFRWSRPAEFDLRREVRAQVEMYWTPMPPRQRALLVAGPLLAAILLLLALRPGRRNGATPITVPRPDGTELD